MSDAITQEAFSKAISDVNWRLPQAIARKRSELQALEAELRSAKAVIKRAQEQATR